MGEANTMDFVACGVCGLCNVKGATLCTLCNTILTTADQASKAKDWLDGKVDRARAQTGVMKWVTRGFLTRDAQTTKNACKMWKKYIEENNEGGYTSLDRWDRDPQFQTMTSMNKDNNREKFVLLSELARTHRHAPSQPISLQ